MCTQSSFHGVNPWYKTMDLNKMGGQSQSGKIKHLSTCFWQPKDKGNNEW
jgi:hypothetical protein